MWFLEELLMKVRRSGNEVDTGPKI